MKPHLLLILVSTLAFAAPDTKTSSQIATTGVSLPGKLGFSGHDRLSSFGSLLSD
jgi:hypothetical protein